MVDVTKVPPGAFGYVPTPAIVAPLEFTMPLADYAELGGHLEAVVPIEQVLSRPDLRTISSLPDNPWPVEPSG